MRRGKTGLGVVLAAVATLSVMGILSVLTGTFVLVGVALFFAVYVGVHWMLWGRFDQGGKL